MINTIDSITTKHILVFNSIDAIDSNNTFVANKSDAIDTIFVYQYHWPVSHNDSINTIENIDMTSTTDRLLID